MPQEVKMPGPGGLVAFGAMWEGNTTCIHCKKPLRNKGKFKGTPKSMTFYCDRWWCRFVLWVKGLWRGR